MNIIIIGGGKVGSYVAKLLIQGKHQVKIIEDRELPLEMLPHEVPPEIIIEGNGADPGVLKSAGIYEADVVAALTERDEINLVVSTIAKYEFGIKRVIARVNSPKNSWLFGEEMGVDVSVNQAQLLAYVIADQVDLSKFM